MIYKTALNDHGKLCNCCTIYIVLLVILFEINVGISCAYFYLHCYLKKSNTDIANINANTETVIIRHINEKYQTN